MKMPLRGSSAVSMVLWLDKRPRSQIPIDWPKITIRTGSTKRSHILASFYTTHALGLWIDDLILAYNEARKEEDD